MSTLRIHGNGKVRELNIPKTSWKYWKRLSSDKTIEANGLAIKMCITMYIRQGIFRKQVLAMAGESGVGDFKIKKTS